MTTNDNDEIGAALRFDPLAQAEVLTGKSYKEDEGTQGIGFLMHLGHTERKAELLKQSGDTHYSSTAAEQLFVFFDLGFEVVLCEHFAGKSYSDEPAPAEQFFILWHPDGVLATMETYQSSGRNSAKMYYNVEFAGGEVNWNVTSSGSLARGLYSARKVWVGDHDAREGVRYHFNRLREAGEFLPVWVERPFLWLLNYMDTKNEDYNYKAINERRIALLPEHVRRAITPEI